MTAQGSESVRVVPIDVGAVSSGDKADDSRIHAARRFFDHVARLVEFREPSCIIERLSLFAGGGTEIADALGVARVVEVNAPVAEERKRHFGLRLEDEARRAESAALRGARVVAVSAPLASWALGMGACAATVVANGADVERLDPNLLSFVAPSSRRRLGFSKSIPVVGFVGSLKPWHGVDVLIDAVSSLANTMQIGLLVVGDGPERDRLRSAMGKLSPRVTWVMTGAVELSRVPEHIAAMDIAAAPYVPNDYFYFSPLKVVEAMAAGRAVVASDFAPIRDLLGTAGILVEPGDSVLLGDSLGRLIDDPDTRRILGAAARLRALERSSWSAVADTVLGEVAAARDAIRIALSERSSLSETSAGNRS
jgi:glycosyltransferase involved in cell wall biosynthesis